MIVKKSTTYTALCLAAMIVLVKSVLFLTRERLYPDSEVNAPAGDIHLDASSSVSNREMSDVSMLNESLTVENDARLTLIPSSDHGSEQAVLAENVASNIDLVTGSVHVSLEERFEALSALEGKLLSGIQADRLIDFLENKDRFQGMPDEHMYVFMNDFLALFHSAEILDDRYLQVSGNVIDETSDQEVIRDYALQGLSRAYPNANATQRDYIRGIFWNSLAYRDTSLAATSLLALDRLRRDDSLSGEEPALLRVAVTDIIVSDFVDERVNISAMQIAADLDILDIVPSLVDEVHSTSSSQSEKLAAFGALRVLDQDLADSLLDQIDPLENPLIARRFNPRTK